MVHFGRLRSRGIDPLPVQKVTSQVREVTFFIAFLRVTISWKARASGTTGLSRQLRPFREGLLVGLAVKDKVLQSISLVPTWQDDDIFVWLYDPSEGKGLELYGYLKAVNEGGAALALEGKEFVIQAMNQ